MTTMKISILTPSFNSAPYIDRAIRSVLVQDYANWEHIIMDGGSTDGTLDILKKYPHLIWISEKDSGQSDAMNKAFQKSTGQLIIYLNADDEFHPGLFSVFISGFKKHPSSDILVGDLKVNKMGTISIRKPSIELGQILDFSTGSFPGNPVAYCYKRSLQEKIGPFPLDNHYTMDYWFLLRAYLLGKPAKVDFTCGTFYLDGNNKTSDYARSRKSLKSVRDHFIKRYFYAPAVLEYIGKKLLRKVAGKTKVKAS
jgi:glycosyltransferase involved in cell wall biosynthesis